MTHSFEDFEDITFDEDPSLFMSDDLDRGPSLVLTRLEDMGENLQDTYQDHADDETKSKSGESSNDEWLPGNSRGRVKEECLDSSLSSPFKSQNSVKFQNLNF